LKPMARKSDLLIEAVDSDVVVYDQLTHRVCCLNLTAAMVWRSCDGNKTVVEIAARLSTEMGEPQSEELVWEALQQLADSSLLIEPVTVPTEVAAITRREVVRRLALLSGGATILWPVVDAIVAPVAAQALSPGQGGGGSGGGPPVPTSTTSTTQPCTDVAFFVFNPNISNGGQCLSLVNAARDFCNEQCAQANSPTPCVSARSDARDITFEGTECRASIICDCVPA